MIKSEHVFNDNIKLAVRQDGFRVYILTNLVDKRSLQQVNSTDIKVASIKDRFDFKLLSELTKIEMLTFMDITMTDIDVERLLKLTELKRLVLVDCIIPGSVNLNSFHKLEELDLNWKSTYHFTDPCTLKDLVLRKLNTDDLSFLNCKSLETLEVIQGKLASLNGIGKLQNLKALTLLNLAKVSDLHSICLLHNIEYLHLRGLKSKIDSRLIMDLRHLKWLVLENSDFSMPFDTLLEHQSLRGVIISKRGKLTGIEKRIMSTFSDTKYGYFRSDNVRDRLTILFQSTDVVSKN